MKWTITNNYKAEEDRVEDGNVAETVDVGEEGGEQVTRAIKTENPNIPHDS